MSSVRVNILSRTPFMDRTDPAKPTEKMDVTFQTPEGRIGTITILKSDVGKPAEDQAIAAEIKKMGPSVFEQKEIKL